MEASRRTRQALSTAPHKSDGRRFPISRRSTSGDQGQRSHARASTSQASAPVIDLTGSDDEEEEVLIVGVKQTPQQAAQSAKRRRSGAPAAAPGAQPHGGLSWDTPGALPPLPPSPKGLKCPICLEKATAPASTPCGHVFCKDCIAAAIKATKKCPKCRKPIRATQVHRVFLDGLD